MYLLTVVPHVGQLAFAKAVVISTETPSLKAAGLTGCEGVDVTKSLGAGIEKNFTNFFNFWGPVAAVVCLVIGALAALADKGGKWFKRVAILVGLLLLIGSVTTQLHKFGGPTNCP